MSLVLLDVLPVAADCFAELRVSLAAATRQVFVQGLALSPSGLARGSSVMTFGPGAQGLLTADG